MALRRVLEKSIIETGNERGVGKELGNAKVLCHCGIDGRCRLAGLCAVGKQGAKATFSAAVIARCLCRSERYTDPDPNIQFEMMRQQNWSKGG